MLGYEKVVLHL